MLLKHEVHTSKNKSKRKALRDIFAYHFLFYICLIVAVTKAVLNILQYLQENICVGVIF